MIIVNNSNMIYEKLTEERLEKILEDLTYSKPREYKLHFYSTKVKEQFDQLMKEEFNKTYKK